MINNGASLFFFTVKTKNSINNLPISKKNLPTCHTLGSSFLYTHTHERSISLFNIPFSFSHYSFHDRRNFSSSNRFSSSFILIIITTCISIFQTDPKRIGVFIKHRVWILVSDLEAFRGGGEQLR